MSNIFVLHNNFLDTALVSFLGLQPYRNVSLFIGKRVVNPLDPKWSNQDAFDLTLGLRQPISQIGIIV